MGNRFTDAVNFTLMWEGGYSNNHDDPGRETNYGISKKSYPHLDIANLTKDDAIAIYKQDYWDKLGCEYLPTPLDIVVFDTGVNMGISRALNFLKNNNNWRDYMIERIMDYLKITNKNPSLIRFMRGWMNRVYSLYKFCKKIEMELNNGKMHDA